MCTSVLFMFYVLSCLFHHRLDILADKDYRRAARINTSPDNDVPGCCCLLLIGWYVQLIEKQNLSEKVREGGMLAAHQNIPAAPTHTCTHTNESSRYSYSNEKILSFKLWLSPSVAFNACRRDWKVGEQRKGEREGARERDAERRIWVSPEHHHTLSLTIYHPQTWQTDRQTDWQTDKFLLQALLATPRMAVKTAVRSWARERERESERARERGGQAI